MTIIQNLERHYGLRRHEGEFGLEIETEATKNYEIPKFSFWEVHNDNSLRGPAPREYVLRQPLLFKDVPEALREFKDKTAKIEFIQDSITTSIHVHINMLNETWLTFGNFLTVYSLVENLLVRYAGEDRKGNMFCLPMCDAEENFKSMLNLLHMIEAKRYDRLMLDRETTKYSALNLGSLANLGSLEQRSFRGVTDTDVIYQWISILHRILEYSRQKQTPIDFVSIWKEKGPEVLTDIFGPDRKLLKLADEDELLEKNFWYSINIANAIKDWNALDKAPKPKKPKTKDLETVSMKLYGVRFDQLTEAQKRKVLSSVQMSWYETEEVPLGEPGWEAEQFLEEIRLTERTATGQRARRAVEFQVPPAPAPIEDDF